LAVFFQEGINDKGKYYGSVKFDASAKQCCVIAKRKYLAYNGNNRSMCGRKGQLPQ
jgi:hypothetical protein